MTHVRRRIVSWVAAAAIVTASIAAWPLVPGANGPVGELQWILTHANFNQRGHRSAASVLLTLEHADPQRAARVLEALLLGDNPRVARHALTLLADRLEADRMARHVTRAIWQPVFVAWLEQAAPSFKFEQRAAALRAVFSLYPDDVTDAWTALPLTQRDARWIVAGMLDRSLHVGLTAIDLVFRETESQNPLRERFLYAGQVRTRLPADATVEQLPTAALMRDWSRYVSLAQGTLVDLLDDEAPRVRWAAGRILAVAGDARGLPAFGEWLRREHRRRNRPADLLMTALHGAEWRTLAELDDQPGESP